MSHSHTLLASREQGLNLGDQLLGDGHQCHVFRLKRGFDLGKLFVLGLVFIMGQHFKNALLIPSRWIVFLFHLHTIQSTPKLQ